jgi:hypothetical protein
MFKKLLLVLAALVVIVSMLPIPVYAQNSPWSEIVDGNGNILYNNLTDLGVVQENASWMPNVPFIDGQATYHRYMTPSGNIVVMPSATTLFFMALHPDASGINNVYSALGNGVGVLETMLAGYITPADMASAGYTDPDSFWQSVINGKTNIFTFEIMGAFLRDLITSSLADGNFYTMLLLYLGGDCSKIPGGCPEIPTPPPSPSDCPTPFITTGPIQIMGGSGDGGKIAPPNPVVIGQDPDKRGVDVKVSVSIPPITYHYYEKIVHHDMVCAEDPSGLGSGCAGHPNDPNWKTITHTWFECIGHTKVYPDFLNSAQVSISLTQDSRNWILTDLAQAYPGASLIHPDFSFFFSGPGSLSGGNSILWTRLIPSIQTADPGDYDTNVFVHTSGTPVSAPRQAQKNLGQFTVKLVRVILTGQP